MSADRVVIDRPEVRVEIVSDGETTVDIVAMAVRDAMRGLGYTDASVTRFIEIV